MQGRLHWTTEEAAQFSFQGTLAPCSGHRPVDSLGRTHAAAVLTMLSTHAGVSRCLSCMTGVQTTAMQLTVMRLTSKRPHAAANRSNSALRASNRGTGSRAPLAVSILAKVAISLARLRATSALEVLPWGPVFAGLRVPRSPLGVLPWCEGWFPRGCPPRGAARRGGIDGVGAGRVGFGTGCGAPVALLCPAPACDTSPGRAD